MSPESESGLPGTIPTAGGTDPNKTVSGYSLELVAGIAARLLHENEYREAARRALGLLKACEEEMQQQDKIRAAYLVGQARYKDVRTRDGKTYSMPWKELLRHITGEQREERSFPKFKRFMSDALKRQDAMKRRVPFEDGADPARNEIIQLINEWKEKGLNSRVAEQYRREFADWEKLDNRRAAAANAKARRKKAD